MSRYNGISIITSVHNQLAMNRLFFDTLKKNSTLPFELIVIDNISDDGSREYFQSVSAKVIANSENWSYPVCQNQGIREAKYELMAFLNNDILLPKGWDRAVIDVMEPGGYEVFSVSSNDRMESRKAQRSMNNRFKRIKYALRFLMGINYNSLRLMTWLTYGNFNRFVSRRMERFGDECQLGFSGSAIFATKGAIDKIGLWDERLQEADFDIFCRTMDRHLTHGDIKPLYSSLGVYIHHYQRLSLRNKHRIPFVDAGNFISCKQKWGERYNILTAQLKDV